MNKKVIIIGCIMVAGIFFLFKNFMNSDNELSNVLNDWYENHNYETIEEANEFAEQRLSKKYKVYVNDVFVDIGYDWDGKLFVPLRSISESLNWVVNWIPEKGLIEIIKGDEQAYVDIVNLFGKAYLPIERLEILLSLHDVNIENYQINIRTSTSEIVKVHIDKKLNFYIDDMKMTDEAVYYEDICYVPVKAFALSFASLYRYDAENHRIYVNNHEVNTIFVEGVPYAKVEDLKSFIDTGNHILSSKEKESTLTKKDNHEIFKGPNKKEIALTFDDFLGEEVYLLLDVLDQYGVKATFFIIGNCIEENKEVLKAVSDRGHLIENHTWNHLNTHSITPDEVRAELISTQIVIEKYSGKKPTYYRPPGGYYNQYMVDIAKDIGLTTVLWSLNSGDANFDSKAQKISDHVLQWTNGGTIIVMHTKRQSTIEALPNIIEQLLKKGYSFVTIDKMIGEEE